MRLRLRLVITMIVLVAVGLAAVDAITLSSLRSSLYGRVDDQLRSTARLITAYVDHSERHGHVVTVIGIDSRVNPGSMSNCSTGTSLRGSFALRANSTRSIHLPSYPGCSRQVGTARPTPRSGPSVPPSPGCHW